MSQMIDERELMWISGGAETTGRDYDAGIRCHPEVMVGTSMQTSPPHTGESVFGHAQVADTFLVICDMTTQERRILAGKLAAYDAVMADQFAQQIIDAVFSPGFP